MSYALLPNIPLFSFIEGSSAYLDKLLRCQRIWQKLAKSSPAATQKRPCRHTVEEMAGRFFRRIYIPVGIKPQDAQISLIKLVQIGNRSYVCITAPAYSE